MKLRQFKFTVENVRGIRATFLGDGTTLPEAFADGLSNAIEHGLKRALLEDSPKPEMPKVAEIMEEPDL